MPIQFGSKLSSAVANATFLDKTINDVKKGILGIYKISLAEPTAITDIQQYIADIADSLGVSGESDANRDNYSSNEYILDGDDRKVAIGKLDARMKVNSDAITAVVEEVDDLQEQVAPGVIYFGDSGTDGSWRIFKDGTDLKIQLRVAGIWNTRDTFLP